MRALLVVLVLCELMTPRPADACSSIYVDMFTLYEKAALVVTGTSGSSTGSRLPVTIEATHKGTAPDTLSFDVRRKCGAILQRKRRVIAFVDAKGWIGHFVPRTDAVAAALQQWIALRDGGGAARLEVLDSLGASKDPTVAKAARHRRGIEQRLQDSRPAPR